MAVERIEEYRQQNGVDILKVYLNPNKKFCNGGYFYAPAEAIDLITDYTWTFSDRHDTYYIICNNLKLYFHQLLFMFYNNYFWNGYIDHTNNVIFDNTDENLNAVTPTQNNYNKLSRGYLYRRDRNRFVPRICINQKVLRPRGDFVFEDAACLIQYDIENDTTKYVCEKQYSFDFKKYRKGSEDILDLERTGKISEEEATYQHIMRYADNAWYYLRYGLQEYFKDNHIPVPEYRLDEQGFMIHPITGQKLCPFTK